MGSGHGQELNLTLKVWRQKNSKAAGRTSAESREH